MKKDWRKNYRQVITCLDVLIDLPEVKMCSHKWSKIDYSKVPSRCLLMKRKGHFNEKIKGILDPTQYLTGNRFPDDKDRVQARQNVIDQISKKIHGSQVFPHELVEKIWSIPQRTTKIPLETLKFYSASEYLYHYQFKDIIEKVGETINKMKNKSKYKIDENFLDLSHILPMCDVSGSMSGTPMYACIGLGLIISELKPDNSPFKHKIMTFDDNPEIFSTEAETDYVSKVQLIRRAKWGGSTDFTKAMKLVLDVAIENKLKNSEIPDLIVFTDMQFNQNGGMTDDGWKTIYDQVSDSFKEKGYKLPHITFWNLRGSAAGFPVKENKVGVSLLSGFSPSLLKLLISGDQGSSPDKLTPAHMLEKAMKDERYDIIRKHVQNFGF